MNSRFSEYATSGAFTLALTRNQVSALSMLDGGAPFYAASYMAALERKGLVEAIPAPTADEPDRLEFRATFAGLLTARLTQEAGLTNGPPDPLAAELQALRQEIVQRRQDAADARRAARAAIARKEAAELALENAQAQATGDKLKVRILLRDPLPELSDAELLDLADRGPE